MSGRARDGRLVHFAPGDAAIRPGDVVETVITYAAPHHLVADGALVSHRRTRAGDNHEEGVRPRTSGVGLGLPVVRRRPRDRRQPDEREPVGGCAVRDDATRRATSCASEIDEVGRRASRTVELGGRAVVIAVAVFVLLVGLVLPWMNGCVRASRC